MMNMNTVESGGIDLYGEINDEHEYSGIRGQTFMGKLMMNMNTVESGGIDLYGEINDEHEYSGIRGHRPLWGN